MVIWHRFENILLLFYSFICWPELDCTCHSTFCNMWSDTFHLAWILFIGLKDELDVAESSKETDESVGGPTKDLMTAFSDKVQNWEVKQSKPIDLFKKGINLLRII